MRPMTERMPKSLIRIKGRPFLEYQLEFLKEGGVSNIVLCVGYLGRQIEEHFGDGSKFGVDIKYSYEHGQLLGTAGALKQAYALLDDEFFTLYGDSYIFLDFGKAMEYFRDQGKLGMMAVFRNFDEYGESNTVVRGKMVSGFSKEEKTYDTVYIEYGVNVLKKEALDLVPLHQPYVLDGLFRDLIEKDELLAYEVERRFYQIGSPKGLVEFMQFLANGKEEVLP